MTNEINLYSKEQTDALLAEKEDAGTAYTKAQTDALLDGKEDVGIAYTKAQTDALLAEKEDAGLSYTKAQVDGLLADKASYGEVVELGGGSDIGSDLRPIKIVNGVAVAVANPLIDTETEQTINAKKTFAVNAKSAAPASGAVDISVVNANWASQTGAGKPNNLLHDTGMEVNIGGLKDFVQLSRVGQHFRLTGTNRVEICRCAIVTDTTIYLMVNSRSSGSLLGKVTFTTDADNKIATLSKVFTGIDLATDIAKIYAYTKDDSVIIALGNDIAYNNYYSIFIMGAFSGAGLDRALDFSNSLRNATAEIDGNTVSVSVRI